MTGIGIPTSQSRMPRMLAVPGLESGPWAHNGPAAVPVPD
jgi:hypothetical protein